MLTKEELDQLTEEFSDRELGERFGVYTSTIRQWRLKVGVLSYFEKTGMDKSGGKPKKRGNAQNLSKGQPVRDSGFVTFFDSIDTPVKAYFLGLLAADGWLHKKMTHIGLTVQPGDINILECFIQELGTPINILEKKDASKRLIAYEMFICSMHMCQTLSSWGITSGKSRTLELLQPIPFPLQRHFVRGVWDGDGHVTNVDYGLVSGSEAFINQVEGMIHAAGLEITKRYDRSSNCHRLYGGRTNPETVRWMYHDAYPVLKRKADQFSRFWAL